MRLWIENEDLVLREKRKQYLETENKLCELHEPSLSLLIQIRRSKRLPSPNYQSPNLKL